MDNILTNSIILLLLKKDVLKKLRNCVDRLVVAVTRLCKIFSSLIYTIC